MDRPLTYKPSPAATERGFTLVELMVTVAIMIIISTALLLNYAAFDSTVTLKARGYEIVQGIRTAQAYATNVRAALPIGQEQGAQYSYPYGISFSTSPATSTNQYEMQVFVYRGPSTDVAHIGDNSSVVEYIPIAKGYKVSKICITTVTSPVIANCNISRLDVSFRRPEVSAYFYALAGGTTIYEGNLVRTADIYLADPTGQRTNIISINTSGYASAELQ